MRRKSIEFNSIGKDEGAHCSFHYFLYFHSNSRTHLGVFNYPKLLMEKNCTLRSFSLFCIFFLLGFSIVQGQNFQNGDLVGTVATSSAPNLWQQINYGDPISLSTSQTQSTSDVCSLTGPVAGAGISGNPYSGSTFVTGLNMRLSSGSYYWHEGLQQTVGGLTVGTTYTITLWQAVCKQSNALDQSGSWAVYRDVTLIGITAPSTSTLPYNTSSMPWQQRSLTFTATATSHTIKFLPEDDDPFHDSGAEGLRMAIDAISLSVPVILPTAMDFDLELRDEGVALNWETLPDDPIESFFVERSPDGNHFEQIEELPASRFPLYSTVDEQPYALSYYRLGKKLTNGDVAYSEVKSIRTQGDLKIALADEQLRLLGGIEESYRIAIYNVKGQEMFVGEIGQELDLSGWGNGIYIVQLHVPGREAKVLREKIQLRR